MNLFSVADWSGNGSENLSRRQACDDMMTWSLFFANQNAPKKRFANQTSRKKG